MPRSVVDLARLVEQREEPATALAAIAALRDRLDELEELHVDDARRLGWSWGDIAQPLGISRQAVHHKHARRVQPGRLRDRRTRMSGADVQRCAARARREAAELGHDSVGTDHLLLALVDEEAPGLLDGLAITPEELRVAVADRRGAGVRRPGAPELLGEAATALDEAVREATRTPEEGIGVEQFLLTLLRGEESAAGQVLARLGCSKDDVERRLAGAR